MHKGERSGKDAIMSLCLTNGIDCCSHQYDLSFDLNHFRHQLVSKEFELLGVDVAKDTVGSDWAEFTVGGDKETRWDAIVTWVEVESEGGKKFSTLDNYHLSNVRFLNSEGLKVGKGGKTAKARLVLEEMRERLNEEDATVVDPFELEILVLN